MRRDDLTSLFAPPPAGPSQDVGYRQGVVLSWNPDTAENTVRVGGATLTNLPILNSFEALLISAGAVVGLITAGPSWAILGRITIPGTAGAGSAAAVVTAESATVAAAEARAVAAFADLATVGPTVAITLPAARCLVYVTARITVSTSDGAMGFTVTSGMSSIAADLTRSLRFNLGASAGGVQATAVIRLTDANGLVAGDNTFVAKYSAQTGSATFANRTITVVPF
jgi:hypothetical protein